MVSAAQRGAGLPRRGGDCQTGHPTSARAPDGGGRSRPLVRALVAVVRLYQRTLSPLIGPACRFYPPCSEYAVAVIESDGPLRGGLRALGRLLRCSPFRRGGLDLP